MNPNLVTATRLKEAQVHLGKTDAEMDVLILHKMKPWAHYTKTGIASAMIMGKIVRLTGWTMAYFFGETDDKTHDPVRVRGIMCKRGEPCKPFQEPKHG